MQGEIKVARKKRASEKWTQQIEKYESGEPRQ